MSVFIIHVKKKLITLHKLYTLEKNKNIKTKKKNRERQQIKMYNHLTKYIKYIIQEKKTRKKNTRTD